MKPMWNRVSLSWDTNDQKAKSFTFYFDYDLRCWLLGFSIEIDRSWYDLKVSFGPLGFSVMYWRTYVYVLGDDYD
jgi:hypothetical protein